MSYSKQHIEELSININDLTYQVDILNTAMVNMQYSLNCLSSRIHFLTKQLNDNKTHIIYQKCNDYEEMPFDI